MGNGHPTDMLTKDEIDNIARLYYRRLLEITYDSRHDLLSGMIEEEYELMLQRRDGEIQTAKFDLSVGNYGNARLTKLARVYRLYDFELPPDSPEERHLLRRLTQAELELLFVEQELDEGNHDHTTVDRFFAVEPKPFTLSPPAESLPSPAAAPSTADLVASSPLADVLGRLATVLSPTQDPPPKNAHLAERTTVDLQDQFFADNSDIKTRGDYIETFRLFDEITGHLAIRAVRGPAVRDYRDTLLKLPARRPSGLKGDQIQQLIKRNQAAKKKQPTITPHTVNDKRLSNLRAFFAWAVDQQILGSDPTLGVRAKMRRGASKPKDPFTMVQLDTLFRAPLFTGAASESKWNTPGEIVVRDHRFWTPLLCLFAGTRLGEAGQLRLEDIIEHYGHWTISIMERLEAEDREDDDEDGPTDAARLKTAAAKRGIPVHPELIRMGFLEYVAAMKANGHERLFPNWAPDKNGSYSETIGPFLRRLLESRNIKTKRVSAHSLRHNFRDLLRNTKLDTDAQNRFFGHSTNHVGERYGSRMPTAMEIELFLPVAYPDLDLCHLYPGSDASAVSHQAADLEDKV